MNINNTQSGYISSDSFIENNRNQSNIDQLLSLEIISTTQPSSSVTFNPINMIPSQTSLLSNMQQQNNLLSSHQQQFQQRTEERQPLHREQQEQRQQRRRQYESPEEHRYIGYMLRLYERNPRRFEQELEEQAHQAYLERRSPTFDETTDKIFQERQLEDYHLERMTPQDSQEKWEQQQLNHLQENPVTHPNDLLSDNSERYAIFLRDQLLQDQQAQMRQIDEMEQSDYT